MPRQQQQLRVVRSNADIARRRVQLRQIKVRTFLEEPRGWLALMYHLSL